MHRAFLSFILFSLALGVVPGRGSTRVKRDVTVQNDTSISLDWVGVNWGGRIIKVGVLPPGESKTNLDAGLPTSVVTNVAVIEFINEDTPGLNWESGSNEEVRARREKSWTRVPVDVSQLRRLGPEPYQITFRILSATKAEVLVERIEAK